MGSLLFLQRSVTRTGSVQRAVSRQAVTHSGWGRSSTGDRGLLPSSPSVRLRPSHLAYTAFQDARAHSSCCAPCPPGTPSFHGLAFALDGLGRRVFRPSASLVPGDGRRSNVHDPPGLVRLGDAERLLVHPLRLHALVAHHVLPAVHGLACRAAAFSTPGSCRTWGNCRDGPAALRGASDRCKSL